MGIPTGVVPPVPLVGKVGRGDSVGAPTGGGYADALDTGERQSSLRLEAEEALLET